MNLYEIQVRLEAAKLKKGKVLQPAAPSELGLVKQRSTAEIADDDLAGLIQRAIASEIARQLDGRPAPADQKPLSVRAQMMFERMHKAVDGVAKHELSVLPSEPTPARVVGTMAPVPPGPVQASVLQRDNRGKILRVRYDGADIPSIVAVVTERDSNGAVSKAVFERVAA